MFTKKTAKKSKIILLIAIAIILGLYLRIDNNLKYVENKDNFQDKEGNTYLYSYDTYYYFFAAKNNPDDNLISWLSNFLSKITGIELLKVMNYLPLFFLSLSIILMFFITYNLTENIFASFISSLYLAIMPKFFYNSYFGFPDTNTLIHFFNLALILLIFCTIDRIKNKKSISLLIISFLIISLLFEFTWKGYLFIYLIIFFSLSLYFLIKKLKEKKYHYLLLTIPLMIILYFVKSKYEYVLSYLFFKTMPLRTVEELSSNLNIINYISTIDYFFIALIILSFSFYYFFLYKKDEKGYIIMVWFIFTFLAGMFAQRFVFFFCLPYCIMLGLLINEIKKFRILLAVILILTLCFVFFATDYHNKLYPKIEDNTYDFLTNLNVSNDTVIITWWSRGIFYESLSNRKVISKSTPTWGELDKLSNMFLTTNESEAMQIANTIALGKPYLIFISGEDFSKIDYSIQLYSKYNFTNESIINKMFLKKNMEKFKLYKEINTTIPENKLVVYDVKI